MRMIVGIPRTPYFAGVAGLSSTFTLPTLTLPSYSSAMASITGAIALHGAHQVAQKSTMTGIGLCRTSASKFASVNARTFSLDITYSLKRYLSDAKKYTLLRGKIKGIPVSPFDDNCRQNVWQMVQK